MTDSDDRVIDITGSDVLLDRLLAGDAPAPGAPAWCDDVALLVSAAHAPARPDELAREAQIVRQMRELRVAALVPPDRTPDRPTTEPDVVEPAITDLAEYRARHMRKHRARHAAARLEASRHPAVRTLGRVIAMNAATVTAAAVIGAAAAAAATTGIVATVVVPALSNDAPEPAPATTTTPTTERPDRSAADGSDDGTTRQAGEHSEVGCPSLLPSCVPVAPTLPPDATVSTASTTTTTTPPDGVAATDATPTSEPPSTTILQPTTTVPAPPPTTTVPPEPQAEPELFLRAVTLATPHAI